MDAINPRQWIKWALIVLTLTVIFSFLNCVWKNLDAMMTKTEQR